MEDCRNGKKSQIKLSLLQLPQLRKLQIIKLIYKKDWFGNLKIFKHLFRRKKKGKKANIKSLT